jgi:hypothetical protein
VKESTHDLIDRWQDTMYPEQGRPFRLDVYQNDHAIWLLDTRQDSKFKLSRNRMEADIEMKKLLPKFDAAGIRISDLTHRISQTADQDHRRNLERALHEEENKKLELKTELDKLEKID